LRPGFRKPRQLGTVTGRDDPNRNHKRKRERQMQAAMLEYFEGLQKRVLAAVREMRKKEKRGNDKGMVA
jgi:hypothetical protein